MPVEFIGLIGTQNSSEIRPGDFGAIDKSYVGAIAQAHEYAGFDRALIGYFSIAPDGFQVAAYAFQQTSRLKILLAHRPGFVFPTLAARQLATLDQFGDGRLGVHIITGGSDEEQRRDGDYLTHDERYERTDEYLDVVRKTWTETKPFDHSGKYYRLEGNFSAVKPVQKPHIPVYFGGSSDIAIRIAGKHADVYALWGESLAQVRETIAKVRAAAAVHGRENHIRFSLSLRPIVADTEKQAWDRADDILRRATALRGQETNRLRNYKPEAEGSRRLLATAAQGRVLDKRLWTELAPVNGGGGNSTGLVGTGEQIVESLLDYYDLGVTTFLIRGFDQIEDALHYGRDIIPGLRAEIARREAAGIAAQ